MSASVRLCVTVALLALAGGSGAQSLSDPVQVRVPVDFFLQRR